MDRMLFVAMTGARHAMLAQDVVTNNLANASTTGFRQQLAVFSAWQPPAQGLPTRTWVQAETPGADFSPGVIQQTGNPLDVALTTPGFLAVRDATGQEAYTRAGDLKVLPDGRLVNQAGLQLVGDDGPVVVPTDSTLTIAPDGTLSATPIGQNLNATNIVTRLRLVNPPPSTLVRGADGLFRSTAPKPPASDASVRLVSGALEGSNVNVVDAMTQMISLSRQFDLQIKMMQTADTDAQQAAGILNLNA